MGSPTTEEWAEAVARQLERIDDRKAAEYADRAGAIAGAFIAGALSALRGRAGARRTEPAPSTVKRLDPEEIRRQAEAEARQIRQRTSRE